MKLKGLCYNVHGLLKVMKLMKKHFFLSLVLLGTLLRSAFAQDGDISFQIINSNQNTDLYKKWANETISAFKSHISTNKQISHNVHIYITSKVSHWPRLHIFYNEAFFGDQPVAIRRNRFVFNPIVDAPGLQNNEFTFKEGFATYLITAYYEKKIPVWAQEGLPVFLAKEAGAIDWIARNFTYFILLSSEKGEYETVENILKFKNEIDNKKTYAQKVYSWAFTKWLFESKYDITMVEKIFKTRDIPSLETLTATKNIESAWLAFIQKMHERVLPYQININTNHEKNISLDDIKKFFLMAKKNHKQPSHELFRNFFDSEINKTTYENLKTLLTFEHPTIREYATYTFGLISDRSVLPLLIDLACKDDFAEVRERAAIAIREINMSYTPQILINNLNLKDAQHVANTAEAMGIIGDRTQARALIQKMHAIGSPDEYLAITKTQNYVSDYDVIDGRYKPIIKTHTEGVIVESKILWVTIVQPKMISALNNMALDHTSGDAQEWYKWLSNR